MGTTKCCLFTLQVRTQEENRQTCPHLDIYCLSFDSNCQDVYFVWDGEGGYHCHIYDAGLPVYQLLLQLSGWAVGGQGQELVHY